MSLLPEGFAALDPFVAQWALATAAERTAARDASTPEEREAFYAVAREAQGPALAWLDTKGLRAFDAADERLMRLMLSLAHVALAVELQRDHEEALRPSRRRMTIRRATADLPPA